MKIFLLLLIVSNLLTGCMTQATSLATTTPIPFTETPTLTFTPQPTPTETPVPTEAEPKVGDVTTVTENGHTYTYIRNEQGQDVREVANFPLGDYPYENFAWFKIGVDKKVPGEQYIDKMIHEDDTPGGIGSYPDGGAEQMPIKQSFMYILSKRFFLNDERVISDIKKQEIIYYQMLRQGEPGHEKALIPITVNALDNESNIISKDFDVSLNTGPAINLLITTKDTVYELAKDPSFVSTGQMGDVTWYAFVGYENEKMMGFLAFDVALNEVSEEILRNAIFLFPASLAEKQDQTKIEPTDFSVTLASVSTWVQPLGGTTKDLEIEFVLPVQP